ncbi:MAG: ECF-type riboflavin transporter substrate-binding protein [Erysipelotrichaceae bacterium]|nr:ECF-type riboflavin transporter substrate-binding protein [Erysipelotrichaceae bacterium]
MKKTGILGTWNTQSIVAMAVGAALYGVLMVYGGVPIMTDTSLTTAMVIPVFVGALYGPVPAMVCCGVGNVLADLIGGWGMWFDWSIGNAVMGFLVGTLPLYGARVTEGIFTVKHAVIYVLVCIFANCFAFGIVTPIFTTLFYQSDLNVTFIQAGMASLGNILVLTVVGLPVLFLLAKRYASRSNLSKDTNSEEY